MQSVVAVIEIEDTVSAAVSHAIRRALAHEDARSLLVLLATDDREVLAPLAKCFSGLSIPVIGGVFPRVFTEAKERDRGGFILVLAAPLRTVRIPLSVGADGPGPLLERFTGTATAHSTIITFFDAACLGIDSVLEDVFDLLGSQPNYVGGGAGMLDFSPSPCVIDQDGVHEAVAVIGVLEVGSIAKVAHGWQPVGDSMRVTAIEGRQLQELEHRPASQLYREQVAAVAGITQEAVADNLGSYPLGVVGFGQEVVVRDVIGFDGADLLLVAETSHWAVVRLLHGDHASLLAAAVAVRSAIPVETDGEQPLLVFDCISRLLHLGERFEEERQVLGGTGSLVGAATIGEVCNPGDRFIDVYNKAVVGVALRDADSDAAADRYV